MSTDDLALKASLARLAVSAAIEIADLAVSARRLIDAEQEDVTALKLLLRRIEKLGNVVITIHDDQMSTEADIEAVVNATETG